MAKIGMDRWDGARIGWVGFGNANRTSKGQAMSAIEASTVKCATLVDGTLRLTLDIEPDKAQAAFALFGTPGRHVEIAALPAPPPDVDVYEAQRAVAKENWHQLGPLCRAAITLGNESAFQQFIGVANAAEAEVRIKTQCHVESRKELDTDPQAGRSFKRIIDRYRISRGGEDFNVF
jgi:hypothetical protein